jgi:putative ABC transport system permease protein
MFLFPSILQDFRYALRAMRNGSGLTAIAILSLGLAIGSTIAIFSVMYALILKPLPVFQPDRLVEVPRSDGVNLHYYRLWKQLEAKQGVFAGLLAYYAWDEQFNLTDNGESRRVAGMYVSGSFFQTLSVPSVVGRTLEPADDQPGAAPVCVIGYGLWGQQYGQSQSVIGRTIQLNGHAFQIVGVAPKSFFGVEVGKKPEIFMPLEMQRLFLNRRWSNGVAMPTLDDSNALSIVARLEPNVDVIQADAWLRVQGVKIYRSLPPARFSRGIRTLIARPLPNGMSRSEFSETVLLLITMAGVGLLIACANLGNLLLARATKRQGEIATRVALGATRRRLVRQLMTESIALSAGGLALGLLIKRWGAEALLSVISYEGSPIVLPTVLDLSWDGKLILFTVGLTLVTALLFGLAPAIQATHLSLYSTMQNGATTGGNRNRRSNAVLIVVQVGLSIALLYSAGLLVRTLNALLAKNTGYEAKGVLVAQVSLEQAENPRRAAAEGEELLRAFRSVPGVMSASWTAYSSKSTEPELNVPQLGGAERRILGYLLLISPGFFETRRTPMLVGRDFNESDNAESPPVVILSDFAAQRFFPGANPIGLSIRENDDGTAGQEYSVTVVGIAKNIDFQAPTQGPLPILYRPVSQCSACAPMGRYEVRFAGPVRELTQRLKVSAAMVNSKLSLEFHPLSHELDGSVQRNRSVAWTASLFALLAGLLAMIGVYGVTSYVASQRTREIGIRIALGARPANVFRLIMGEIATLVLIGVALGVVIGYGAAQALTGMLWGVTAVDPLTLIGVSTGMILVVALAAFLPARRAMRVDPVTSLRYE